MNTRLVKAVVIVTALCGLLQTTQRPAYADRLVFSPGFDGGPHIWEIQADDSDDSHLSDAAPSKPQPKDVPYSITLFNPTNWTIGYSINGKGEPRLKPGETACWTTMGSRENPAVFRIEFDDGRHQKLHYRLENYQSYVFRGEAGGLSLHKQTLSVKHRIDVSATRIEHLAGDYAHLMEGRRDLTDAQQVLTEARRLRDAATRLRKTRSEAEAYENLDQVARRWDELHSHLRRIGGTRGPNATKLMSVGHIIDGMREAFRKG